MQSKHQRGNEPPCRFKPTVFCPEADRRCDRCGWNPEVEQKRREKIREEHTHVTRGY